jgi:23S rRNA (guanine745-N1)-methyltransferase
MRRAPIVAQSAKVGRAITEPSLIAPPLACTVRNCGLPLARNEQTWSCSNGHTYDIARSGYLNLLQPQDRRSLAAGDAAAAVEARARLHAGGVGSALIKTVLDRLASLQLSDSAVLADLGSGSGDALGSCVAARGVAGIGIDLSVAAVRHAARRFPRVTWVVANADRRLPLIEASVSFLMSLHGRRNAGECARALAPSGFLFVAVPAADDLIELREFVQGVAPERSKVDALLAEHEPFFTPVEQFVVREQHTLNRESLTDLLQSTYRGARTSARGRVASLPTMDVTVASDCVLFQRRP